MTHLRSLGALAAMAILCLAAPWPTPALAHEEGSSDRIEREIRETREERESRENREDRESREERDRSDRDKQDRGGNDGRERDKSSGGSDHSGKDKDKDNRGKDGNRSRREESRRGGNGHGNRGHRIDFERDSRGAERVRGEVLVVGSRVDIARVRAAGLTVIDESHLAALEAQIARVRVPDGQALDTFLEELRRLVPDASVAPDHVFRPSAGALPDALPDPASAPAALQTIGIVDTGIEDSTITLRSALLDARGFASGGYTPRPHGTAVADIAARAGVSFLSADVFGVDAEGGLAATTVALAQAFDWLIASGVRVVNISIEGPDNPLLARVIRRAVAADIAVVAAAGNGGPSAPPAYPAAYDGVIAVTAVDDRGRVYRRANRGRYVDFAARGVNIPVPRTGGGTLRESGTSFAAPVVSAVLALRRGAEPAERVEDAVAALARRARDLGPKGRDEIYGWGELRPDAFTTASGGR